MLVHDLTDFRELEVWHIGCNMGTHAVPDVHAHVCSHSGIVHTHRAKHSCLWYNYHMPPVALHISYQRKSLVYTSHAYLILMIPVQQLNLNQFIFKCSTIMCWISSGHNSSIQDCEVFHHRLKVKVHSLYTCINEYRLWVLVETFHSVQNIMPTS